MRIGLKIWSKNIESFGMLTHLHGCEQIDFVELYTDSQVPEFQLQELSGIPIILHARNTINAAETASGLLIEEPSRILGTRKVIVHPGFETTNASIERLSKNISHLQAGYEVILENVPLHGLDGSTMFLSHPDEFCSFVRQHRCLTCLDFSHAIIAANNHGLDAMEVVKKLLSLEPAMYHLCDGEYKGSTDRHLGLGEGNFPLRELIGLIPEGSLITLETPKMDFRGLSEDLMNLEILRGLLKSR
jgi:endonuclease IV